ncbi:MAG: hypothetical protein ACWA41_08665 [Putridiphycobacter sp.]
MKYILTLWCGLLLFSANSQNIKKMIDQKEIGQLNAYLAQFEADSYHDEIYLKELKKTVHPMIYAVRSDISVLKTFIKNKAVIEDYHKYMSEAFAFSLSTGDEEKINLLFQEDPNVNEICGVCHEHTAIMVATVYGNEAWYFKLKSKSELGLKSEDGNSLLHLASACFNPKILNDILTIEEIDINDVNNFGQSALEKAAMDSVDGMFFKLLDHEAAIDEERIFAAALYGGNQKIFDYCISNFYNSDLLWLQYDFKDNIAEDKYFPYEMSILSGNISITKWVIDEMLSDIEKDSTNEKIKLTYELLSGQGDGYSYVSITESIAWGEKEMFEYILTSAVKFNKMKYQITYHNDHNDYSYEQTAEVYFTKYDYRAAKRQFGKEYVTNLYKDLEVEL